MSGDGWPGNKVNSELYKGIDRKSMTNEIVNDWGSDRYRTNKNKKIGFAA